MYGFPWVLLAHLSGCNQEFPNFPKISRYPFPKYGIRIKAIQSSNCIPSKTLISAEFGFIILLFKEILTPTFGIDCLDPLNCVVIVSTVVTPREILAGTASTFIQKLTQDSTTINMEGM